jgi:hypothetical protein
LTADEFTVVVPEGKLMTRAERVDALKRETPEPRHAIEREQVQAYDDAWSAALSTVTSGSLRCGFGRMVRGVSSRAQVNYAKP